MKFCINEWRKIYDDVQFISRTLRGSLPNCDENGLKVQPKYSLSNEVQQHMEIDLNRLLKKCSKYLDSCGIAVNYRKMLREG